MARKPRIHFNNAVYHVILRGLDDQAVFKSVADRRSWEALVAEGVERFGHKIHAYCWMNDHVHLVVQVADAPLSKIMQNLSFRYTRYFNKHYHQDGPIFHGRYKAILIEPEPYLNGLVRFVHNVPVRAGKARAAANFKWSSHVNYLGREEKSWVHTATVLDSLGRGRKAINAFEKFVASNNADSDTDFMRGSNGGRLLGSERFARKALKPAKPTPKLTTLARLVKVICQAEGIREATLKNDSRARYESQVRQIIAYLATELEVASLTDLSQRFNRDLTTMSRNQRYFRERLAEDRELQKHVRQLRRLVVNR